ncbi:MAG: phosphatase PAP2 family protein [Deltaproteobacteria bacterium]|nr:phosphatase PAP2 family protein [Deltaproteobacteria bacterium]
MRQTQTVLFIDRAVYRVAMELSYSVLWLKFWYAITWLGSSRVMYTAFIVVVFFIFRFHFCLKSVLFAVLAYGLCNSNALLKAVFALERPVGLASFYPESSSYTFPSGHAFGSVLLFFLIPRLLWLIKAGDSQRPGRAFIFSPPFMLTGVLLVSLSRVFLGVHWFSDIVGGMLWGAVVSLCVLWLYRWMVWMEKSGEGVRMSRW